MQVIHLHPVSICCRSGLLLLFISRSRIYESMVYLYESLRLLLRAFEGFLGSNSSSTNQIVNIVVNLSFELLGC